MSIPRCKTCCRSYEIVYQMMDVRICRKRRKYVDDDECCFRYHPRGTVFWFTGMIASGKTTIASELEQLMLKSGKRVENLDSDEVRDAVSPDLGHSVDARDMNTKRLAFMADQLVSHGVNVIVAAVSSRQEFRDRARRMVEDVGGTFVEIYVKASEEERRDRDPDGMYEKADEGEIDDIAGVHQEYEEPESPDIVIDTQKMDPEDAAAHVFGKKI